MRRAVPASMFILSASVGVWVFVGALGWGDDWEWPDLMEWGIRGTSGARCRAGGTKEVMILQITAYGSLRHTFSAIHSGEYSVYLFLFVFLVKVLIRLLSIAFLGFHLRIVGVVSEHVCLGNWGKPTRKPHILDNHMTQTLSSERTHSINLDPEFVFLMPITTAENGRNIRRISEMVCSLFWAQACRDLLSPRSMSAIFFKDKAISNISGLVQDLYKSCLFCVHLVFNLFEL